MIRLPRRLSACLCLCLAAHAQAETQVIVNATNPVQTLSRDQVSRLFMAKIGTFPNGMPATPLDAHTSDLRERFYLSSSSKTPMQMRAYWSRLTFTGNGSTPHVTVSREDMLNRVRTETSAIGYVDGPLSDKGVKTVLVLP